LQKKKLLKGGGSSNSLKRREEEEEKLNYLKRIMAALFVRFLVRIPNIIFKRKKKKRRRKPIWTITSSRR